MNSVYPKDMVWRANLAAMFTGGDRLDCLHDIFVFVECDGLTIEQAYAKACYKNSSAGLHGRLGDANLLVNMTDFSEGYLFEAHSSQESINAFIDLKEVDINSTEKLMIYMLANGETGTAISKQLGCSVKTAIRKIKKLRVKLEKAIR